MTTPPEFVEWICGPWRGGTGAPGSVCQWAHNGQSLLGASPPERRNHGYASIRIAEIAAGILIAKCIAREEQTRSQIHSESPYTEQAA